MKVVLSTLGKFHTFDLARELQRRDALTALFTGYPRFKLKSEAIPLHLIRTFPWVHGLYMAVAGRLKLNAGLMRQWEWFDRISLDRHVAGMLPECDVFVGLSSSALITGRTARSRGARYVCDRGSTHIRVQDRLLKEEHARWGVPFAGIDPRIVEREEAEYSEADCITVPSAFNVESFLSQGVPAAKVHKLPYGVDVANFRPTAQPDTSRFDVLFAGAMSIRKGVPDLLHAYQRLKHPRKTLTFAGAVDLRLIERMKALKLWPGEVRILGHLPQSKLRDLMSVSHVLVLPSLEEGLAMVQAQAMACACPVVASAHTGASDLFSDGVEGFIVPVRAPQLMADRLQQLADQPELRRSMAHRARLRVEELGGWSTYGNQAYSLYEELAA
ncbi:glycosyltransferase family 4 protein [Aquabacterium sp.]|uniref:glycosyltransferase family 4 protein n=1 Tax=Aquabacterium sp. TaxID=1872578 RepID=UPI0035B3C8BC